MEYKVIGWTHYDDGGYTEVSIKELHRLRPVIVEEIRRCGYRFGGDAHNYRDGCTAVLNSGEKYCISSFRVWGGLMAEAWNITDRGGYEYMEFYVDSLVDDTVYPPSWVDNSQIVDKSRLTLPKDETKEKPKRKAQRLPKPEEPVDFDSYVSFAGEHRTTLTLGEEFASGEPASHEMRLDGTYYRMIAEGVKTVELRLLDEKRRLLRPGDTLTFVNRDDERERTCTRVEKMHVAGGFDELLFDPDMLKKSGLSRFGPLGAEELMETYYPTAEQRRLGVVGIEVKLVSNDN